MTSEAVSSYMPDEDADRNSFLNGQFVMTYSVLRAFHKSVRSSMFAYVMILLRSLLLRFARRPHKSTGSEAPPVGTVITGTPEGRKKVSGGFDMRQEIVKLAGRIVEPVAARLATEELEDALGRIRHAFEDLYAKRTPAETDLTILAVTVLEPTRPMLKEAEFARAVDRLRGAMAGFCQGDRGTAQVR